MKTLAIGSTTPSPTQRSTLLTDTNPFIETKDMAALIDQHRGVHDTESQSSAVEKCLKGILWQKTKSELSPHPEQVRVVRRLVYGLGDVLLVARTGFGKSLILHAYSVLTSKITIQITPLNSLGEEQFKEIGMLPTTRPCLLNANTKSKNPDILQDIIHGHYTHILLGPEQAISDDFLRAVENSNFQSKIGLLAIDECHLVCQWKDFRPQFANLSRLRRKLQQSCVLFGCTATISDEAEHQILTEAGFNRVGRNPGQTEVVRTSIDRPDVFLYVQPIPRKQKRNLKGLYFLIQDSIDQNQLATPQQIPKTIIFIDSINACVYSADIIQDWLRKKTEALPKQHSQRYNDTRDSAYNVQLIVQIYHANVPAYDQEIRYKEFAKSTAITRIMVATTSLGMGINIPDVKRVIVYDFPLDKDISDVWQRVGRGGRSIGQTSEAYIFIPYWAFDSECRSTQAKRTSSQRWNIATSSKHKNSMYHTFRYVPTSRLAETQTPADISDVGSVQSDATDQSNSGRTSWAVTEQKKRDQLPPVWKAMVNQQCHRRPILEYLGEMKIPGCRRPDAIPPQDCCNGCNQDRQVPIMLPPDEAKPHTKPTKGSRAFFAWKMIDDWCLENAKIVYNISERRFPVASSWFMDTECQYQIAALFPRKTDILEHGISTLIEQVGLLKDWQYKDQYGEQLVEYLQSIISDVGSAYTNHKKSKRKASPVEFGLPDGITEADLAQIDSNINSWDQYITQHDNTLAKQVAIQEEMRRSIDTGSCQNNSQIPSTPSNKGQGSTLSETGDNPIQTVPVSSLDMESINGRTPKSTTKKRKPLGEIDPNIVFTPVSKKGRIRTISQRAMEGLFSR